MFRDRQRDGPGRLRGSRIHRLVPLHHIGDGCHGLSGKHLRGGFPGSPSADDGGGNPSIAPSDHSRSASFARLLALAPASQCTPAPCLVLVAALPSEPGQFLPYQTSSPGGVISSDARASGPFDDLLRGLPDLPACFQEVSLLFLHSLSFSRVSPCCPLCFL